MSTTDSVTRWADWLRRVRQERDPKRAARLAAEMLLAAHVELRPEWVTETDELPSGWPKPSERRAAAHVLLTHAQLADAPLRETWTALAVLERLTSPKRVGGSDDELHAAYADAVEAERVVGGSDVIVELVVLNAESLRARDVFDNHASLRAAERMLTVIARAETTRERSPALDALGDATWIRPMPDLLDRFRATAHARAAIAARADRDYTRAISERDRQIIAIEQARAARDSTLVEALGQRASLARVMGDVRTEFDCLQRQAEIAASSPEPRARMFAARTRAAHAHALEDWDEEREQLLRRLSALLESLHQPADLTDPSDLEPMIATLHEQDRRQPLTSLGNVAHDLARNLEMSGAATAPAAAAEARAWIRCARDAWRHIAMNGAIALDFRETMIAAQRGETADPREVGRSMIESSRQWRRPAGQRRAAIRAVQFGAAGDEVVLDRLRELRQGAPQIDAAFLDVAIAHWYLRAVEAKDLAREAQRDALREAAQLARGAVAGLSVRHADGSITPLDTAEYLRALDAHVTALERLRAAGDVVSEAEMLAIRATALPAIARRLSAAGGTARRESLWQLYLPWLVQTAELAVRLDRADIADFAAEVARRDQVGILLRAIANDREAPAQLSRLAAQLIATLSATVSDTESEGGSAEEDGEGEPPAKRARMVDDQLTEALDIVAHILSPLARGMLDPHAVVETTTEDVLTALAGPRAAVLTLWRMPGTDGRRRILRHLAWRTADGEVAHHADIVDEPPAAAVDWDAASPAEVRASLPHLTRALLPEPLLAMLESTVPDDPLDLVVVPTGYLDVPFATLPLTAHLLVDLAVLRVVQSLQSAAIAAGPPVSSPARICVAVYDPAITHAPAELEALRTHYPGVRSLSGLAELRDAFGTEVPGVQGLAAFALHGSRGATGWAQAKRLPSGELLTTAHVLEWRLPRLVVAASCNSDIRADAAGELGGFPLAFQLRGARSVVGTLRDVEDLATAQIMSRFYAESATGSEPAPALRRAQRSWLAADPADRYPAYERWAYLTCYGMPVTAP